MSAPLSDDIALALAEFFTGGAGPTHRDLNEVLPPLGAPSVEWGDQGPNKEERVRHALTTAARNRDPRGADAVVQLVARLRVGGHLTKGGEYAAADHVIDSARRAFEQAGWRLGENGELAPLVLTDLDQSGRRPAIEQQIVRLQRGAEDAALLIGTAKELLETTSRYVLEELGLPDMPNADFGNLVYMARERLGLLPQQAPDGAAAAAAVREAFDGAWKMAKAVNDLRNLEGTGHGRTRLPGVSAATARAVVRAAAVLAELMLGTLDEQYGRAARSA